MITSAAGSTHFAFGATATLCSTQCECFHCLATASLAGSFLWAHCPACLESSCLHSQRPPSLLLHVPARVHRPKSRPACPYRTLPSSEHWLVDSRGTRGFRALAELHHCAPASVGHRLGADAACTQQAHLLLSSWPPRDSRILPRTSTSASGAGRDSRHDKSCDGAVT